MENLSDNLCRLHEETLQWRNPERQMEDEEQEKEDQVILDSLLHEVPLTQSPASETVPVSAVPLTQIPIPTPGPILVRSEPVSTMDLSIDEDRIPFPAVSMNVPIQNLQSAAHSSFGGFEFQGNFSSQARPEFNIGTIPVSTYPGLDGHPKRITPIPISPAPSQPSEPVMGKSPEELLEETSGLIQKYERAKAEDEKLVKKYTDAQRTKHVYGVQFGDKKSTDVTH